MKKIIFLVLIVVIIFISYKAYVIEKVVQEEKLINPLEVTDIKSGKQYNKVKDSWPGEGDVFGSVSAIDENEIVIEELINWKCFYSFDYTWDDKNTLSTEEIDGKYNLEYLPWCNDPSGGTLYEYTGEKLVFEIKPETKFSITIFSENASSGNVSMEDFIEKAKSYEPYKMMVGLTTKNNQLIKVSEIYND